MPTTIEKIDITGSNLFIHNGLIEGLIFLALGVFGPKQVSQLFTAITMENQYDTMTAFLSDLASRAGYVELGIMLELINISASARENVQFGDTLVKITFQVGSGVYVSRKEPADNSRLFLNSENPIAGGKGFAF